MSEIGITNSQWYQNIADAVRLRKNGSTSVGTKTISENGVYIAADEEDGSGDNLGWYGYSKVTVNVPERVIGIDPDDDNEHMITVDKNTGELVDTILPSSIAIVTQPTKLIYEDGETIDLTGAIIKAYTASGDVWTSEDYPDGVIPLSEIIFEPTEADVTKAGNLPYNCDVGDLLFDGGTIDWPNRIFYKDGTGKAYYKIIDEINTSGWGYDYYRMPLVIGLTQESVRIVVKEQNGDIDSYLNARGSVTYEGTLFYYTAGYGMGSDGSFPRMYIPGDIPSLLQEIGAHGGNPKQEIALKWTRLLDSKELTAELLIEVEEGNE